MTSLLCRCVPGMQVFCALLLSMCLAACGGNSNSASTSTATGTGTNTTPTPGSSNPGGAGNSGGSSSASANYLYVGGQSEHGSVDAFKFDDSSGALTAVAGSPFNLPSGTTSEGVVAVSGGFVYTMNSPQGNSAESVYTLKVDASTGSLTQVGNAVAVTTTSDGGVRHTLVSDNGQILYVMTQSVVYAVGLNNGSPVLLNSQDVGDVIFGIADAGDKFIFVGVQDGNPKSGFQTPIIRSLAINPNGSLSVPITVATLTDANIPRDLAADRAGKFVALTTGLNNNEVSMYVVGSGGSLTPVAGSPFSNAGNIGGRLAFDTSGQHLYLLNNEDAVPNSESVVTYSVGSDGSLTQVQLLSLASDVHERDLEVSSSHVFVVNNSASAGIISNITVLRRDASGGQLTLVGTTNVNQSLGEASLLHQ